MITVGRRGNDILLQLNPDMDDPSHTDASPAGVTPASAPDRSSDSITPGQLIDLSLRGDRNHALELLVDAYRDEIFDLCVRVCGNRSDAEDLTQETFIRAYENLGSYRGEAAPRSWLYRIAINRSISFTRRLKRWRMQRGGEDELFPELPELATASPGLDVEKRDLIRRAHKEIQHLPNRQRLAVVLRHIRDLPYEEIAQIMGITSGAAKANVHHGLKKLREALGEDAR